MEIVWNRKEIFWIMCYGVSEFETYIEKYLSSNVGLDLFPEHRYLED